MNDIPCAKCGEPYSLYALRHDVAEWDDQPDDPAEKFQSGDGCPTCEWGDKAGDVSVSRFKSVEELEAEHMKGVMRESDEDPLKYLP
jgi:hypothetical protein